MREGLVWVHLNNDTDDIRHHTTSVNVFLYGFQLNTA